MAATPGHRFTPSTDEPTSCLRCGLPRANRVHESSVLVPTALLDELVALAAIGAYNTGGLQQRARAEGVVRRVRALRRR